MVAKWPLVMGMLVVVVVALVSTVSVSFSWLIMVIMCMAKAFGTPSPDAPNMLLFFKTLKGSLKE